MFVRKAPELTPCQLMSQAGIPGLDRGAQRFVCRPGLIGVAAAT